MLWVANNGGASVSRIDTTSGKVVTTVKTGLTPRGVGVLKGAAWVANAASDTVSRVEPTTTTP